MTVLQEVQLVCRIYVRLSLLELNTNQPSCTDMQLVSVSLTTIVYPIASARTTT